MKLLLIEDDPLLRNTMQPYLEAEGYVVTVAATVRQALTTAYDHDYDCVVVDIGLPDGSGLDVVRQLKKEQSGAGIIIVSAKDSLPDKLMGLELGADDYLTKPFHLPELNARIKSVLRRRLFAGQTLIQFGAITINPHTHQVTVAAQAVVLTEKEYQLLLFFAANPNRLLTKSAIAEYVWGDHMDLANSHDFLYTHIKNLRKKLLEKGCPDYLKTRYGVGYLFSEKQV
ncbi:response regulator transcription factor [Fibrella sp. HMF5335]|uniref:Response regulator transcription factor n=1 Tax=Fibrella rubiginis TaxID=2817060 RepID=A0A939GKV1_9BACT|nr:response regulator transcription factor [Fibrella rubiginis]MBO0938586.1 response regulator transcription factor [Fibrella rubiginis]